MSPHAKLKHLLAGLGSLLLAVFPGCAAPATYQPVDLNPPPVSREFRAAWISSVGDNSWLAPVPLTTAQQKAALVAMLDQAVRLRLNAVVFQVRPACDALYASSIEPWSEFLTGTMGRAPAPYYDPLEFAITEAHKRGLELHAWFNPYRARHTSAKSPIAANHISRTRPDLVRQYGSFLWLDPGERDVQDYSLRVIMDVVKRYDIDGVHFDDYFYPYHYKDSLGRNIDFPDGPSWRKYGNKSGLSRDDWRRENVNTFIQHVQSSIHAAKPWVKFGISPFGIWRPKNPPQIKGKDAYAELYADSRKWLANGWVDYFSPQLYWGIAPPDQSFPVLLKWWDDQNVQHRHVWPGLDANKVGGAWTPDEIINQIWLTRKQPGSAGAILWALKNLMPGRTGLAEKLAAEIYASPALIPASPWLSTNAPPARPALNLSSGRTLVRLSWGNTGNSTIQLWVLQRQVKGQWLTDILPASRTNCELSGHPEVISVTAVDRVNRIGVPAVMQFNPGGPAPAPQSIR